MKKKAQQKKQYQDGCRVSKSFFLRPDVRAAFVQLADEMGCGQQYLMEALILSASSASVKQKESLFRAAMELNAAYLTSRLEQRYTK